MNTTRRTFQLIVLSVVVALFFGYLAARGLWFEAHAEPSAGSVVRTGAAMPARASQSPRPVRHMPRPAAPSGIPVKQGQPLVLYAGDAAPEAPVRSAETMIIGGNEAAPGVYPWQVALVLSKEPNAFDGQFCGGTLIMPDWVLTAAHCVDWGVAPGELDVVAGRHRLSSSEGERIGVDDFIVHPLYNEFTLDRDYALVHLVKASTQPTVSLDGVDDVALEEQRATATVIGWGVYSEDLYLGSDPLMEVQIPLRPSSVCQSLDVWGDWVTENMLCAGDEDAGESPCYGDSGGPLVVRNGDDSAWVQIGIVSWGPIGCNVPGSYAVFSRISTARAWIAGCLSTPGSVQCRGEGAVPDASEPDNGPESATLVDSSSLLLRQSFHIPADSDWLRFVAKPGTTYWIESTTLGVRSDTVLWLRKADGFSPLLVNDDKPGADFGSRIMWTAPYSSTMYVQMHSYATGLFGRETQYELAFYELDRNVFLPLALNE